MEVWGRKIKRNLPLAPSLRGNVATGKRISKLGNLKISKFVGEV